MPNKHHQNKRKLTVWLDEDLKFRAQKILQRKGITLTDAITDLFVAVVKEDEKLKERK